MKKIFLFLFVLVSFYASAQPGYTTINARYSWLAGKFSALHLPGFNTTPSLQSGQWPGDGAVGIDTAANIMYFYSGGTWRAVGTGTVGGSTTQVQYNNAGAFGGISGATTNGTVLTLTSPVINVTSDATGDVYYRSSGGAFTRLPIGTTGQQLTVSGGGLPSWAASGGTTPTLQQVLTAGSTLTGSNTIDVGSLNTFIINNGLSIQLQTTFGTEIADLILQPNETTLTTYDGSSNARGSIIMHPTGDVGLIATDGATYTDSIMLLNHDAVIKVDSLKIRDASLGAASVGYVLTLDNVTTGATKWAAGGGGGNTIYTADDAIASDRTVDLNGKLLQFSEGGNNLFYTDPVNFDSRLASTDGTAISSLRVRGNGANVYFDLNTTDGTGSAQILGDGVASTLTYTAGTHTFNIPLSTGIFKVTDSGNDLLFVDVPNVETTIKANDGTANSFVRVRGAAASALFTLDADNGSGSNVGIEGDAGAESITYTADLHQFNTGIIRSDALHNNAFAQGNATQQDVRSGTYTPTLTNVTNVAASTAYACQWIRVGNVVTVSGKVDIDVTLGIASELGMSLPITSALAADENLGGTASSAAAASLVSAIRADATNDRAAFVFTAVSLTNDSYSFEFTYLIL